MTKIKKLFLITLSILLVGSMGVLAQTSDTSFSGGINEVIATIDKNNLDETEKEGLLLMREEEKLARDVYKFIPFSLLNPILRYTIKPAYHEVFVLVFLWLLQLTVLQVSKLSQLQRLKDLNLPS